MYMTMINLLLGDIQSNECNMKITMELSPKYSQQTPPSFLWDEEYAVNSK